MHRFYCDPRFIRGDHIELEDPFIVRHLKNALRFKVGDEAVFFDGKGHEFVSVVETISEASIALRIKSSLTGAALPALRLTIACAIPKKSKFDDIVDKLTQLGVDRIIPLKTERMILKLDAHKEQVRLSRWKRIAISAGEQSRRRVLPVVERITDLKEVLKEGGHDIKLIPTLSGQRSPLKKVFSLGACKDILVLIGPEGDFSDKEVESAKKAGFVPVSLGDLVLRVETAAVAAASIIKLRLSDENS